MLVGHLRPTAGHSHVLGALARHRLDRDSPPRAESIKFTRAFHATWDDAKAAALLKRFCLPPDKRVRQLSRGNRARLCLLLALSFNPELIILDEPTSGLDPIVRRDFIENIVAEIGQEGKTVLFSSHIVEEVERVADAVGIINDGKLLLTSSVDELKESHKRIRYATNGTRPDLSGIAGVLGRRERASRTDI